MLAPVRVAHIELVHLFSADSLTSPEERLELNSAAPKEIAILGEK